MKITIEFDLETNTGKIRMEPEGLITFREPMNLTALPHTSREYLAYMTSHTILAGHFAGANFKQELASKAEPKE